MGRKSIGMTIDEIEDWEAYITEPNEKHKEYYRNLLVERYDPLVWKIAIQKEKNVAQHRDDLHSYGIFGLIQAIERFHIEENNSFSAYASQRIAGSMIDGIRKETHYRKRTEEEEARRKLPRPKFCSLESMAMTNDFGDPELDHMPQIAIEDDAQNRLDTLELLNELTKDMPQLDKEIAYYKIIEGLNFKEIAKKVEKSESRVNQLWNYGRIKNGKPTVGIKEQLQMNYVYNGKVLE